MFQNTLNRIRQNNPHPKTEKVLNSYETTVTWLQEDPKTARTYFYFESIKDRLTAKINNAREVSEKVSGSQIYHQIKPWEQELKLLNELGHEKFLGHVQLKDYQLVFLA